MLSQKVGALDDLIHRRDLLASHRIENGRIVTDANGDLAQRPAAAAKIGKERVFHSRQRDWWAKERKPSAQFLLFVSLTFKPAGGPLARSTTTSDH